MIVFYFFIQCAGIITAHWQCGLEKFLEQTQNKTVNHTYLTQSFTGNGDISICALSEIFSSRLRTTINHTYIWNLQFGLMKYTSKLILNKKKWEGLQQIYQLLETCILLDRKTKLKCPRSWMPFNNVAYNLYVAYTFVTCKNSICVVLGVISSNGNDAW